MNPDRPNDPSPVPDFGGPSSTAADLSEEPVEEGTPGLTQPQQRGHSGMFVSDLIAELGDATRERVEEAIAEARQAGHVPEALLVEEGAIDPGPALARARERYGLDHIDLYVFHVDMGAANLLSVTAARRYDAVPVAFLDEPTLLVAMADPANVLALDDFEMMTGLTCQRAVAAEEDVEALIARLNRLESAVSEAVAEEEDEGERPRSPTCASPPTTRP